MKNLLIPIDFKVESLKTLKYALEQTQAVPYKIILMYSELLSDSITEMMFYNPAKIIAANTNREFEEGINILKNHYESRIHSIKIRLFHGRNKGALENIIKVWNIDEIFIPARYTFKLSGNGFDPIPIIRKSKFHFVEIDWEPLENNSELDQLNALFV